MTKKEFIDRMDRQLNIPETASRRWITFSEDNIEQGQYVDFVPKAKEVAMAEWLEATFSALYFAKQRGGEEVLRAIVRISEVPHTLYPREIIGTIGYLRGGGQPEGLVDASVDGLLDYDGRLPTLKDVDEDMEQTERKL